MIRVKGKISGLESVVANIEALPESVLRGAMTVVEKYAALIEAEQIANVSGRYLNSKGQLRSSIRASLYRDARHVYAMVGTEFYLGRIWNRGFNGDMRVKGHLRATGRGKRLEVLKLSRRGRVRRSRVYETGALPVKPYRRVQDGRPRPWATAALEKFREAFRSDLRRALEADVHVS